MNSIEHKRIGGHIDETKQEDRNGIPVGIVAGYIAAWTPDTGGIYGLPDRFHPGAFLKSIDEHKNRNNRPVRLRDQHYKTIGGFPISTVREDSRGLFGRGEINLDTQLGREAFSLAKQGILSDFSIGFIATQDKISSGVREIFEAKIIEGSIVDEPMNSDAQILEVKSSLPFLDLPLAQRITPWSQKDANARVIAFANSQHEIKYENAFMWHDNSADVCKLQIADVVNGKLMAVPRAIFKIANELKMKTSDIPAESINDAIRHVERYYAKMGLVSPFSEDEKRFFGVNEIKNFTTRDIEQALIDSGSFSRAAAIVLAGKFSGVKDPVSVKSILNEINKINL